MARKPKVAQFPQDSKAPARKKSVKKAATKAPVKPKSKTPATPKGEAKLSLAIKNEKYIADKSVSGAKSFNNGDEVAKLLSGMDANKVRIVAEKLTGESLKGKYDHLNVGMQRMNCGNRIRAFIKKNPKSLGELKKLAK